MKSQYNVFSVPHRTWKSNECRRVRLALGKSTAEFADMFAVSDDTVKSWEAMEGTDRHRDCCGPEAKLMLIAAQMAAGKRANLIRLAADGKL